MVGQRDGFFDAVVHFNAVGNVERGGRNLGAKRFDYRVATRKYFVSVGSLGYALTVIAACTRGAGSLCGRGEKLTLATGGYGRARRRASCRSILVAKSLVTLAVFGFWSWALAF